jgi:hypothetical protein
VNPALTRPDRPARAPFAGAGRRSDQRRSRADCSQLLRPPPSRKRGLCLDFLWERLRLLQRLNHVQEKRT